MWESLTRPVPISEAKPAQPEAAPSNVRRVGYEYGVSLNAGSSSSTQVAESAERQQTLDQLYQAYLTCPWVSAPIDLIARTVTAGGLQVVYTTDEDDSTTDVPADPPEVLRLKRLLRFVNSREDMVQLLRAAVIDLLLFGDSYIEVVELLGEPVALYTLDATSMTAITDEHGEVSGYVQQMDGIRKAEFDTDRVIHISLDAPRGGVYGVSPAQKALLPVTAWLFTEATIKENFRRGDPPRIHVDLPRSNSDTDIQLWREKYTINNLGPKAVGNPVLTTGGGNVQVLDPRKVQDYLETSRQLRDEIISTFGVPPAKLGIIESGNLGGGTGESQDKTFRANTVIPVASLVLEKLNYTLLQQGFGITEWHLEFGDIDYRDSKTVEDIRDMRLRSGAYTLNRYRDEIGEPPVDGGDEAVLVDRQNLVRWADMDAMSKAQIASRLKGTALEPGEPAHGEPATVEKPEPAEVPDQLKPFAGVGPDPNLPPDDRPGGPDDAAQGKAPKENALRRDARRLDEAWGKAYRARRRQALKELPELEQV